MKKYSISTVIGIMLISVSCSNKIHIIEFNEKQKKQITIENLNLFKEKEYVNVFKINKSNIREEIENIKWLIIGLAKSQAMTGEKMDLAGMMEHEKIMYQGIAERLTWGLGEGYKTAGVTDK